MANLVVSVMSRCEPPPPVPARYGREHTAPGRGRGRKQSFRPCSGDDERFGSARQAATSPKDARSGFRWRQRSVVQVLRVLRADLGKLAQRARKMRPQVVLGIIGFAARYRFRDQ